MTTYSVAHAIIPEGFRRWREDVEGTVIQLSIYRLLETWYCKVENREPGAVIARAQGQSAGEALERARQQAGRRLRRFAAGRNAYRSSPPG